MKGIQLMTSGIHRFTGITANVQPDADFYNSFLGLKHVKPTGALRTPNNCTLYMEPGLYRSHPGDDPQHLPTCNGRAQTSEYSIAHSKC